MVARRPSIETRFFPPLKPEFVGGSVGQPGPITRRPPSHMVLAARLWSRRRLRSPETRGITSAPRPILPRRNKDFNVV